MKLPQKRALVPQRETPVPQSEAHMSQREALVPQKEALVPQNGAFMPKKVILCSINQICALNVLCLGSWIPGSNTFRHPACETRIHQTPHTDQPDWATGLPSGSPRA